MLIFPKYSLWKNLAISFEIRKNYFKLPFRSLTIIVIFLNILSIANNIAKCNQNLKAYTLTAIMSVMGLIHLQKVNRFKNDINNFPHR